MYKVFATGATPLESKEEIEKVIHGNFGDSTIPRFYMQSGLCYEKMGLAYRSIMKALSKMLANKKSKSEVESGTADAISGSYDVSDKRFIQPLTECVRAVWKNNESPGECRE